MITVLLIVRTFHFDIFREYRLNLFYTLAERIMIQSEV